MCRPDLNVQGQQVLKYQVAAGLQPRLDDATPAPALVIPRGRKKCSHSGISGSASATGSAYGYPGKNVSTLAHQLPYSRSASSQPGQGFATPAPGQAAGRGPTSEYASSGSAAPGGINDSSSASPGAVSGNPGGSPEGCPLQSTVTITTQYTITVTQAVAIGTGSSFTSPLQNGSTLNASNVTGGSAQNDSDSVLGNGVPANGLIAPKRTKCSKANVSGTAAAGASTGMGGLYGNGTLQGSKYSVSWNASSPSGSDTRGNSSTSSLGRNTTTTLNYTSDADLHGQFWAGCMYMFSLFF